MTTTMTDAEFLERWQPAITEALTITEAVQPPEDMRPAFRQAWYAHIIQSRRAGATLADAVKWANESFNTRKNPITPRRTCSQHCGRDATSYSGGPYAGDLADYVCEPCRINLGWSVFDKLA